LTWSSFLHFLLSWTHFSGETLVPPTEIFIGCHEKLLMHENNGSMRFKNLIVFSFAMQGKQGWKFQLDLNCLVSRLFKARYFLASKIGHNPSYMWRSISNTKFLVRASSRWCILILVLMKDGEKSSIFGQ
jgi:hypothetical protein